MHLLATLLAGRRVSSTLFGFTLAKFLSTIKWFLKILDVSWANQFALTGFRTGRATEMAKAGSSLGAILSAGEWRFAAFLRYVDDDAVDLHVAFDEVYASDDDYAWDRALGFTSALMLLSFCPRK